MKVILSRKGFDSANGGIVSPIFEDGTMISFPIPSNDTDTYNSLEYSGTSYSKILSDLKYKGGRALPCGSRLGRNTENRKNTQLDTCFWTD